MDLMNDIVREFLVESCENLDRLNQDLLELESSPDDRDLLSSLFAATIEVAAVAASCPSDTPAAAPAPTAVTPTSATANDHESGDSDKSQTQSVTDSSVRIDVNLLDKLMNLVGKLMLTRNQVLRYRRTTEDASVTAASQRLNVITTSANNNGSARCHRRRWFGLPLTQSS